MSDTQTSIRIPALNIDIFGFITKMLKLHHFTKRGHVPVELKLKDKRLVINPNRGGKSQLKAQETVRGHLPAVTVKTEIPTRISVSQINFRKNPVRLIMLYDELVLRVRQLLSAFGYKDTKEMFEDKINHNEMFHVDYWITKNIVSGELCTWGWEPVDGAAGVEYKLVLKEINGEKATNFTEEELRRVAADMWEDECTTMVINRYVGKEMCLFRAKRLGYID